MAPGRGTAAAGEAFECKVGNWFEIMVDFGVVAAAGRWVGPENNFEFEAGFGDVV